MEPPKEIYLIRDAANPKKILGDIASEKPMFSDDIKYIRADLVNPKDLEEAADNHIRKVADAAGHPGWDWTTQDIADAFTAGAKWQKEQMLKEAVKGLICATITGANAILFLSPLPKELTAGDKVRIIVCKNED